MIAIAKSKRRNRSGNLVVKQFALGRAESQVFAEPAQRIYLRHNPLSTPRILGKATRALPVFHQYPPQVTNSSVGKAEAHAEFDVLANPYALVEQSNIEHSLSPEKLINEGYKSLDDLSNHPDLVLLQKNFQDLINTQNGFELLKWLERRYPKSHQLVFLVSSFYNQEDFIFIDIETLGLLGHPLFLIGIACFDKQTLNYPNKYLHEIWMKKPQFLLI